MQLLLMNIFKNTFQRLQHPLAGYSALLVFLAIIALVSGIISVPIHRTIDPSMIVRERGVLSIVPIGVPPKTPLGQSIHFQLFENGNPLGPADSNHDDIRAKGKGRYSHWSENLYFSSYDNSDPRTNGRSYTISVEKPVSALLFLVVCFATILLNFNRLNSLISFLQRVHPAYPAIAIGLTTAVFRIWVWYSNPELSYEGHIVLGIPFSDGRGWDSLARDFGQGTFYGGGVWDARRPFNYIFFGSIYALTGANPMVTIFVKLIFAIISAVLIWDTFRRLVPAYLAVTGALCHTFLMADALESLTTTSESLGYFLSNLCIWLFVLATENIAKQAAGNDSAAPNKTSLSWIGLSGICLALANLARTLNLAAVAVLPAVLIFIIARNWKSIFLPKSIVLKHVVMFGLCFAITLAPWLIRQELKYGISSISDNSGEMLYAATHPDYVTWSSRVSKLFVGPSDLGKRFKFFTEGYKENLHKYPGFYLKNAWNFCWRSTRELQVPIWAICLITGLSLTTGSKRSRLLQFTTFLLSVGALAVSFAKFGNELPHQTTWLWLAAVALAVLIRDQILLIFGMILPSVVALGLCAFGGARVTYSLQVSSTILGLWLIHVILSRPSLIDINWRAKNTNFAREWGPRSRRIITGLFLSAVTVLAVGCSVAILRNSPPRIQVPTLTTAQTQQFIDRALTDPRCQIYKKLAPLLQVRSGRLRPYYSAHLKPHQSVQHWAEFFWSRPYERTLFELEPGTPEVYLMLPGDARVLNTNQKLVTVGIPLMLPSLVSFEIIDLFVVDDADNINSDIHCSDPTTRLAHFKKIKRLLNLPENIKSKNILAEKIAIMPRPRNEEVSVKPDVVQNK